MHNPVVTSQVWFVQTLPSSSQTTLVPLQDPELQVSSFMIIINKHKPNLKFKKKLN